MKYVLYSTNPDHYFSKMLLAVDDEEVANKYKQDFYDFYHIFTEAQARNPFYQYLRDIGYYEKGSGNFNNYLDKYLSEFDGIGIDNFVKENCDKGLYKLFEDNCLSVYDYVYNGYEIHYEEVLELK